jgi:hypothetical protein
MTTGAADPLLTDYLSRLAAAAAVLPPDRRAELLAEIGEHIDAARAAGATADEAAVRTLLDRLGEPAEIVAAAADDQPPAPAYPGRPPGRTGVGLETAAVIMLTLGSFIPVLGWLIGAVLLWSSARWRPSEKLLGTLVVPGGPGLLLLLTALPARVCVGSSSPTPAGTPVTTTETCTGFAFPPAIGIPLVVTIFVAPFVVAAVLLHRVRARAAAGQHR